MTCCSCITSSSADCTLAGARLISSASRKLANTGPSSVSKLPAVRPVDARADEVRGHEVRRELDAPEGAAHRRGERLDRQGLGEARHALEQHVPAREQGDQHSLEHRVLPDDHPLHLEEGALEGLPRLVQPLVLAHGRHATRAAVTRRITPACGPLPSSGCACSWRRTNAGWPRRWPGGCGARGWRSTWHTTAPRRSTRRGSIRTTWSCSTATCRCSTATRSAAACARRSTASRVLMLTAAAGLDDLVDGLALGADDYLRQAVRLRRAAGAPARAGAALAPGAAGHAALGRPRARPRAAHRHARRPADRADAQGVRSARGAARGGRGGDLERRAGRARLGRERRPVHELRPHGRAASAPQARRPAA